MNKENPSGFSYGLFFDEWQQSDDSCSLDRSCQGALMLRAGTCDTSWQNLAAIGHEARKFLRVFIIDKFYFLFAESADLFSSFTLESHD